MTVPFIIIITKLTMAMTMTTTTTTVSITPLFGYIVHFDNLLAGHSADALDS